MFTILRMAVGAVVHLLVISLKIVYNILAFLKIRLLALYLIVCGLLQVIKHPFTGENITWFWAGVVVCLLATLWGWSRRFRKKRKRREIERGYDKEPPPDDEDEPQAGIAVAKEPEPVREHYPRYFEAAGHEGYIFAEYSDRYELYHREGNNLSLVRVDEKPLEK